jgi:HAD superfamily hydrolase (TIGR01490 family)
MSKTYIAIYDMDKTVTKRATYNGFLLHMAMRRAPWRLVLAPLLPIALILYSTKIWSRAQLKEFSQRIFIGRKVHCSDLTEYLESHAERVLADNIYASARERIAQEKAQGFVHILATASYGLYVEPIAARLGFEHVIATELTINVAGDVLARIDGENCYDLAKIDRLCAWFSDQGLERDQCFVRAYSDHVSDVPLLEFADEAYATNPHEPLRKLAFARSWKVIDWR